NFVVATPFATKAVNLPIAVPPEAGTMLNVTVPVLTGVGPLRTVALTVIFWVLPKGTLTGLKVTTRSGATARLNWEVSPSLAPLVVLVAVAVTTLPAGRAARLGAVKVTLPVPGTVTLMEPRKVLPWKAGPVLGLAKNSRR